MTDTPYLSSQARRGRSMVVALLALGTLGTTACSDAAAPLAPRSAPARQLAVSNLVGGVTRIVVADTTISTITLIPGQRTGAIQLGNDNRIMFPNGAGSVCDIATSSYGPGTWNAPCSRSAVPVVITARTWTDARGLTHADFQPAMRFVPSDEIILSMKNRDGRIASDMRIDFCSLTGCVNEAAADPTVATYLDRRAQNAFRRIKHFSGYMVTVGLSEGSNESEDPTFPSDSTSLTLGAGW
jgi:hypothetical protein